MGFPSQLLLLRKAKHLTQQQLANRASLHVNQICRYEAGIAQPTLEALIRLTRILDVSLDELVFGRDYDPVDDLYLQFDTVRNMPEKGREVIKALLVEMILKYQTRN